MNTFFSYLIGAGVGVLAALLYRWHLRRTDRPMSSRVAVRRPMQVAIWAIGCVVASVVVWAFTQWDVAYGCLLLMQGVLGAAIGWMITCYRSRSLVKVAPACPSGVVIVNNMTGHKSDVTNRLTYLGWHDQMHNWRLGVSKSEQDGFLAENLRLNVRFMPAATGVLVMSEAETRAPWDIPADDIILDEERPNG